MPTNGYVVSEEKSTLLTLIVDKKGIFGSSIAKKIHEDITTILVTAMEEKSHGNTLFVPYAKTIPEIPEGNYSHIFFVWDGRSETLHILEPLLEKAAADKAHFVFIADYRCFHEKLVRFIHQEYPRASIIFTGDVFGNEKYESVVTNFFNEAHATKTLQLENVGLKHVYPVLFEDVVTELVKVCFGAEKGKVYLAIQRYGMTELSLAHILQKVDPLIKIDFKKEERKANFLPEGEYLFDTNYPAVQKIQNAYTDLIVSKKVTGERNKEAFFSPFVLQKEKAGEKKRKKRWMLGIILIILILISPILLTLFYAGLGSAVLYAATYQVKAGNYSEGASFAKTSANLFDTALSAEDIGQKELKVIFLGNITNSAKNLLEEVNLLAKLVNDGAVAADNFSLVAKGKSISPQSDFLSGINALKSGLLALEGSGVDMTISGIKLSQFSSRLQPLGSILDIAPVLFGFPDKKTYLIILQNNMELRPGGGFIGSYALVTLNKGRIEAFSIHDVYDADGQLKGHVEPPYVIRRYIPQQHWYLRDSNFDVDFSQDSASAAFFLEQETGQKVDGVIGVDLTAIKDILAGIGPVYVPEYNLTVNSNNFFLLTESHAEKNTFAGSTQKKDFLSALFSAMQNKLTSSHGFSLQAILPVISTLQSKDIVFGFSQPLVQDVFTVNGLSDSLWDGRKDQTGVINDTTGINEANIGVNKANYFVTRQVSQQVNISPTGSISGQLTITYKNNSQKGVWPGGAYKNYLRFILPQGAALTGISINGTTQSIIPAVTDASIYEAKDFVAPKGLEVDSTTEKGKQLYGMVISVPEQSTLKVQLFYALSQKIDTTSSTIAYSSWLIKQPGVDAYPYTFSLNVPSNYSLLSKTDWIKARLDSARQGSGNTISFNKSFGEDAQINAIFTQK